MTFILPLRSIQEEDRNRVGGKAAGCATLVRLGYPVPDGFALTTQAFDQLWEEPDLGEQRKKLFDLFRTERSEEILRQKCSEFQEKIRQAAVSAKVSEDLFAGFRNLKPPVAVRSSATAEDSKVTAFAGVFDSLLHVSEEGLLSAVQIGRAHV